MSKYESISTTLANAVSAGASFTVNYPAGRSSDDYLGGTDHMILSNGVRTLFARSGDFSVVFGSSNITVTMATGLALSKGAVIYLNVDKAEVDNAVDVANPDNMAEIVMVKINIGAPAAASANGVCASQSVALNANAVLNGALVAGDVAVMSRPRNIVAAWTTAAVITVYGTDEFGAALVEQGASGTSFTGKKAFKTVTRVTFSVAVTAATVGTGVVMGMPVFVADAVDVMKEIVNAAVPGTAGTFVAGVQETQTATTGDVRGTYAPNSAPNGTNIYELIVAVRAPAYRGQAQFVA